MLLKIYLGISIVTLVCLILANLSIVNRAINKYSDQLETNKKEVKKNDRAGTILAFLKIVIISFIPVFNIIMLLMIVFASEKIIAHSDEYVEKVLETVEKKENE